ncbi:MAG TPA: surface lipoprotein assembly modifier [Allosphingosinicella sp.]|jgi:hypothetical protein
MAGKYLAPALAGAAWFGLTAFSPPSGAALTYDLAAILGSSAGAADQSVEPGEQYPPTIRDRTTSPVVQAPPAAPAPGRRRTEWTLGFDMSVTADSNVTNGSDLDHIVVEGPEGPVTVPMNQSYAKQSGLGLGASVNAGVRVPLAPHMTVVVDAEGYGLDYPGGAHDDASALVAAGLGLGSGSGSGLVQLLAFDRWYGGASAMRGVGLRGHWRQDMGGGQHLGVYVDARTYESDWGDPLTGSQGSVYLTYDIPLDATVTAAGGAYVRRDWNRDDAFSDTEIGAYGSLTHYLSAGLTGGVSGGVSRSWYDAPLAYLSPDPRRDWRYYASAFITTRKPVAWGLYPSLTYTYGRTASSIAYYRTDRHRVRLGLMRNF